MHSIKKRQGCHHLDAARLVARLLLGAPKKVLRGQRLAVIALTCLLPLAGVVEAQPDNPPAMDHAAHMHMAKAAPLADTHNIVVDFELLGADGKRVTLADYRGQYLLLGFGFTHCDYVCPTMAANMAAVLNAATLPAAGVFISVDTERDTPATTDQYAKGFHQRLTGLGGSYQQVAAAANNFKVTFAVTKSQKNYTVLHTASVYLIDPQGKLLDIFALNASRDSIVAAMQQ